MTFVLYVAIVFAVAAIAAGFVWAIGKLIGFTGLC